MHQRETGETECVSGKSEDRKGDEDDMVNGHNQRDSSTPVPETSAVELVCQHKIDEKGGGGKET